MSRGRKPKSNETNLNWQQIFNKNVGKYLQYAIIELGKVENNQTETGSDLLKKIKAQKGHTKKEKELPPIKTEEIPYEIPKNWVWCRLGEIAELKSGNQYLLTQSDEGIMYVKVGDMNLDGNEFEITTSSSFFQKESVNDRDLILTGSIIFPKRGGAIATNKRRAVLKEPILVDSNTMAVIPSIEISFSYFFQWFSAIDLSLLGTEGVIPQVNNKDLNPILFPLPPLSEQEKIVHFLTDFETDNLKEDGYYFNQEVEQKVIGLHKSQLKGFEISNELTYQLSLVKNLSQQLLQDAVQGKLVKNTEGGKETAHDLLKKIKAEKEQLIKDKKLKKEKELPPIKAQEIPFAIPDDWVWCRLGEIGICKTGTTPSTVIKEYFGKDIPFIKPADITLKGLISDNDGLSFSGLNAGVLIPSNSLMMVCIGGSIGKSYYTDIDVSCNQQINTITPLAEIKAQFLQFFMQSNYFQKSIWERASGGTTPIVNRSKWESILIPLPSLEEQHRIVAKIESLMQLCAAIEMSIARSVRENEQLLQQVLREALQGDKA